MNVAKSVIAVSLAICVGSTVALASGTHNIGQAGLEFSQRKLKVTVGDTVVFKNDDGVRHNIIVAKMRFNSGMQYPGEDAVLMFDKAGAFKVRCGLHPKMRLTIFAE